MDLCKDTKDRVSRWWSIVVAMPVHMRLLGGVFLVLSAIFFAVMFSESTEKCISDLLGLKEKSDTLKFLGIGMGGILLVVQALASYKRAKAMEDAILKTEQGQRQERLKNAIEHLGHPSDSVRLGGAYELFHLAQDTGELRKTVFDILCAHIRRTTGESKYRKEHKSKPSEEIQSLLTLLFVEEHEVFKGLRANLQGSWLNGANLNRARLQSANFSGAHLQGAELQEAKLQGAELFGAKLQGAELLNAKLQGAELFGAKLQGAVLFGARLQGAVLSRAQLQGAVLSRAQLQEAELSGAQLQGAESGTSFLFKSFKDRIMRLIGQESKLSGVVFSGGLSQQGVDSLVQGLSDEKAKELREKLKLHIDKPEKKQLPKSSGAVAGVYTKEEAEQWIAEYEQAMSKAPGAGDS